MSNTPIDLTNCDLEPIHIPGQIQGHGFLIVVDQKNIIHFCSDNINDFTNQTATVLLGNSIDFLSESEMFLSARELAPILYRIKNGAEIDQVNPYQLLIGGISFYLIISVVQEFYLLEFEPVISDFGGDVQKMITLSIVDMLGNKNLKSLLDKTAAQVKKIIDYDRVMIYRFAEHGGHGEVVAEAINDKLSSWLGLHFPASDIPKQARELYKLNLTRQIANVETTASPISALDANYTPLDLTHSQLRAVSPIHIQYLKNMGVVSSFSISIIYNEELWGLIACHSYTPRFIDYKSRASAKLIGQILSSALEFRQDAENQKTNEEFRIKVDQIAKSLQQHISIEEALTAQSVNLLEVVNASGAVLCFENKKIKLGTTPPDDVLTALAEWVNQTITEPIYYTANLSAVFPGIISSKKIASGMLMLVLSKEMGEYIIWFKPEVVQQITWAGNPDKPVELGANGLMQISPRHSFEAYAQLVVGRSENWTPEEVKSVNHLKEEINHVFNLKASALRALNQKLRQAYEELDTFSYTISHDLKSPISAIKGYAQLLAYDTGIGEPGQKLLNRIIDRVGKMNFMINEILDYSQVGRLEIENKKIKTKAIIQDVIKDLDLFYVTKHIKITLGNMPDLLGDPVMITQVFANLISNALKYSQHLTDAQINIEGKQTAFGICYEIQDNGLGILEKDLVKIFDLFSRMENVKTIEGSGIGLAIVKRIVDKHNGMVWAKSELGKGSSFFVSFPSLI